jgi:hypothetical protein
MSFRRMTRSGLNSRSRKVRSLDHLKLVRLRAEEATSFVDVYRRRPLFNNFVGAMMR